MAEYIERNQAVALLRERGLEAGEKIGSVFANGIFDAVRFLNGIPAADVAPVMHGRWIMSSDRPDTIICTLCDAAFDVWKHESKYFFYCPHCGSKMDKEADNVQ